MTDIFREVDEMMKRERAEAFWKENGKLIVGLMVCIVIATGLYSAYKSWDLGVREAQTQALIEALEKPDFAANAADIAKNMRPGLRGITLLTAAGTLHDQKKIPEALVLYKQAAEDSSLPLELRGLAGLMSIRLDADMTAQDRLKKLEGLYGGDNNPWAAYARMEAALITAQSGDYKTAQDHLAVVNNMKGLPDTLYEKAGALAHIYYLKTQDSQASSAKEGEEG